MKAKRAYISGGISMILMFICIMDCKTALKGAADGMELCIKTVIPSLFPFLFLTGIITTSLTEPLGVILRPLGKIFAIPEGAESTLILGILGGYPIGAQAIHSIYKTGFIDKDTARRMVSFCNNPGPAFIFGMAGCLFHSVWIPWVIWSIILTGSFLTSLLQQARPHAITTPRAKPSSNTLESSIKAMAKICSWVILFRVFIAIIQRWFLWLFPSNVSIIISGLLELANGCVSLTGTNSETFRFCCICTFLSFGGLCVTMQTITVAEDLIGKQYYLGKLFQGLITIPLSYLAAYFLFSSEANIATMIFAIASLAIAIIVGFLLRKNNTGNYNKYDI